MSRDDYEGMSVRPSEAPVLLRDLAIAEDFPEDTPDERTLRREELLAQLEVVRQRRRRARPVAWGQAVRSTDSLDRRRAGDA